MIIDTRMFRDELDILGMALEELGPCAGHHVIAEAGRDFRGRPKPLYLSANLARFGPWLHKITLVTVPDLPDSPDPWVREHAQRDAMMAVLHEIALDGDIIAICDADEIPSPRALRPGAPAPAGLMMRTAHSAVDWLYPAEQPGSVIAPWSAIRDSSLSAVRDGRPRYPSVTGGGWHFSWLGGPAKQAQKAAVTCHLELPPQEVEILSTGRGYENGHHVGVDMVPVDVDETWPAYIRERRCPESWFRPR